AQHRYRNRLGGGALDQRIVLRHAIWQLPLAIKRDDDVSLLHSRGFGFTDGVRQTERDFFTVDAEVILLGRLQRDEVARERILAGANADALAPGNVRRAPVAL